MQLLSIPAFQFDPAATRTRLKDYLQQEKYVVFIARSPADAGMLGLIEERPDENEGNRTSFRDTERVISSESLTERLDGSTPFRQPGAEQTVRGRSWAIHDGLLNEPFAGVEMYKRVGVHAGVSTAAQPSW